MACSLPNILLVEDNAPYREYVRSLLGDFGYTRIREAADGQEALGVLTSESVDLVISDFSMSPLSGMDLLRALREKLGMVDLPFLMITAVGDDATLSQAEMHGVTLYLKKPLHVDHLREAIVQALRGCVSKDLAAKYRHLRE